MIVCIGDSITVGQYLEPPDVPWPVLLDTADRVLPAGVSNDTTRLGLERFPRDVQAHSPEAVVIQFGSNDCNRWETDRGLHRVSPPAYRANLHEMLDRCFTFGATPYLCGLTPSYKSEQHGLDARYYDAIAREVAQRRGVRFVDVLDAFTRRDAGYDPDALLMADGIHLTGAGHRVYAQAVSHVLHWAMERDAA